RIHFPRRLTASILLPINWETQLLFQGRRNFFLPIRTEVILRPTSPGRNSRTIVSTSGSSGTTRSSFPDDYKPTGYFPPREPASNFNEPPRINSKNQIPRTKIPKDMDHSFCVESMSHP